MLLVIAFLLVATAAVSGAVTMRLLAARREVLAAREALGRPGPTGGHPALQTARNALLAADGWLTSGSRSLLWETLGRRTRDERQIDLLRAAEALGQARLAVRRAGIGSTLPDVPTLCDPISEHRLKGWWPVSALLERLPRFLKGIYCWASLRRPIGQARLALVELVALVDAELTDSPRVQGPPMGYSEAMFTIGTARHLLASASGEVRHARRRLVLEALGLEGGERREAHLLEAAAQAGTARCLGERSSRAIGAPVEVSAVPDLLDPIVALGVRGSWIPWAILTLAPAPIRGTYRWSKLAGRLRALEITLVESEEALTAAVSEARSGQRIMALAAK